MSISRARNAQHKVYIPSSARENHYFLVRFKMTDELLAKYADIIDMSSEKPYQKFYHHLYKAFFKINNQLGLDNTQFIANDKFTRVRYSSEKLTVQTSQQNIFLYNPKYHYSQNAYFDGAVKAKKIALLFLATGDDIRINAAKFHQKVKQALGEFFKESNLKAADIIRSNMRICDHQHLTYDLFAKDKGVENTQVHKLRPLTTRYSVDNVSLPDDTNTLTYAIVDLPINSRIRRLVTIDDNLPDPYNPLYNLIADAFINAAKQNNLTNGAVIANDLIPVVRESSEETVSADGEFQLLGYNPLQSSGGYTCKWSADKLVDTARLIFVATKRDQTSHGFGKFLNQIHLALHSMSETLKYVKDKEELIVRVHQHVGFNLESLAEPKK